MTLIAQFYQVGRLCRHRKILIKIDMIFASENHVGVLISFLAQSL